ncbi:MAG: GntP family permease, partial [Pirellulales bacterium]|nr:GntP family permease [Pirellulales bacterium]
MGSEVSTNPILTIIGLVLIIGLLLVLIAKWRWHVFLALLIPILIFGIIPGVQQNNFISAFETGFGKTLGKIGVVIVLGSIIAEALKHTGTISVITRSIINIVGSNRMPLALTMTGFVLGVAIFSDVAFVILNPLVHASAIATNTTIATMSTGLVGALQLTHAIVPPTPGPLAAAALVGADIGKTIIFGSLACFTGSLSSWIWGKWVVGPRIKTLPSQEMAGDEVNQDHSLPTYRAYAPILVPIVLISLQSIAVLMVGEEHVFRKIVLYVG